MSEFLPFALPEIGEDEISEVIDSLKSGWITTGPKVKRFEQDFTEFLGDFSLYSIAVNSATSGLHLALEAVGIGPEDEVIVPTYTFTATAEIVRYLGATPVFVDVDPETFNMTCDSFEKAITSRTKAVIPVHFAGLACDMDPIITLAKIRGIKVIEDAAHALPTYYKGKLVGTLASDVTVFSFYANKTMTTGEGGMVVTSNPEIAKRCRVMRLHGISRDVFDRYASKKPAWSYEVVAPGYKYNMPDISAAIGIHQLKKLNVFHIKRQAMAEFYNEALKDLPIILPALPLGNSSHAWHLYPIRLKSNANVSRDVFIEKMYELGVGCSVHFIPLHLHPYWREFYALRPTMFPIAQNIFESEVTLPLYTKMTNDDLEKVVSCVRKVFSNG
ncbi:dTDP-4-amino-4,6-dideoxygalactose transaminase [Marinomonas polaris DSM 16579]|uniref:dTDP-4-amino-4,6-dideoxygalactose transaminase n=1 Tax=Marinomonas polaris DSM 16579 TaxID=1122206 RepID=A0A1M5MDF5_9GAMM|nr:DegT/DnrJ/EryC1/StrS family aminotransferase [Marinomonas polaris]SHG75370.1 dTDP-4-amino-4,6-dideoxygalactose transaminase [Marinomonas polaris DSM 16579]